MVSPEERKQDILETINYNPQIIEMEIEKRITKDGEWEVIKETHEARVRVFHNRNTGQQLISDTKGTGKRTNIYGMLADHTADIFLDLYNDAQIKVKFLSNLADMEITGIYPQVIKGVVCGYQIDLERVI